MKKIFVTACLFLFTFLISCSFGENTSPSSVSMDSIIGTWYIYGKTSPSLTFTKNGDNLTMVVYNTYGTEIYNETDSITSIIWDLEIPLPIYININNFISTVNGKFEILGASKIMYTGENITNSGKTILANGFMLIKN